MADGKFQFELPQSNSPENDRILSKSSLINKYCTLKEIHNWELHPTKLLEIALVRLEEKIQGYYAAQVLEFEYKKTLKKSYDTLTSKTLKDTHEIAGLYSLSSDPPTVTYLGRSIDISKNTHICRKNGAGFLILKIAAVEYNENPKARKDKKVYVNVPSLLLKLKSQNCKISDFEGPKPWVDSAVRNIRNNIINFSNEELNVQGTGNMAVIIFHVQ